MKRHHLRNIIIFGTVLLAGLILLQVYWFSKAFDVAERQFDHSVQIALRKVADSVSRDSKISRLSNNFFFINTESQLDDSTLSRLVRNEFMLRNLHLDYELGVYNADDDTLVYGHYVEASGKRLIEDQMAESESKGLDKNFAVYFPAKSSYLARQLDIWIFSSFILLLMMGFFAYAIISLLRERRFAELKTDFINNMTHEFKTPVTNIQIAAEVLRKKAGNDALNVYIDILLRENEKLRGKIDQILLGSSLDYAGQSKFSRVDIHPVIRECAETFQLKVRERNGSIELQFHATKAIVSGDRDLLAQAFINVIDNAEKYSPSKPSIIVRTEDAPGGIRINVIDNGIGVPKPLQNKVFEKFFRVNQGDTHNVKGFGLGLNFVHNVIHSHKGQIGLLNTVHRGTNIEIFLPCA